MEYAILPNNSRARPSARVFKTLSNILPKHTPHKRRTPQQNAKNARKRTKSGRTQRTQQAHKTPIAPVTHPPQTARENGKRASGANYHPASPCALLLTPSPPSPNALLRRANRRPPLLLSPPALCRSFSSPKHPPDYGRSRKCG